MKEKGYRFEPCGICTKIINLEKENYVKLEDYKEGKFYMEEYYHNTCWHNSMHKQTIAKLKQGISAIMSNFAGGKDGLV